MVRARAPWHDLLGADFGLAETHEALCLPTACCSPTGALSRSDGALARSFHTPYRVLLYGILTTQPYFEVEASDLPEGAKLRHGYSRDKRPDLPQR